MGIREDIGYAHAVNVKLEKAQRLFAEAARELHELQQGPLSALGTGQGGYIREVMELAAASKASAQSGHQGCAQALVKMREVIGRLNAIGGR